MHHQAPEAPGFGILKQLQPRRNPRTRQLPALFTQPGPRLCENVHEPRTRSIVFSIVFPRWRPSVRSFFRLTEIEKDLLRAICEPRFSHSLARGCVKTPALKISIESPSRIWRGWKTNPPMTRIGDENREKQCCAILAPARFHTAWPLSRPCGRR